MTISTSYFDERKSDYNGTRFIKLINIVTEDFHGQRNFRGVCKFLLRDTNCISLCDYVIIVTYIDCDKESCEIIRGSIVLILNNDMKDIMDSKKSLIFGWV